MTTRLAFGFCWLSVSVALNACAPEFGSERWCENMMNKPKQEWTRDEVVGIADHCVVGEE